MRNVQQTFSQIVEAVPYLPEELQIAVANVEEPGALSHIISGSLRLPTDDKQGLLEEAERRQAPAPPDRGARARARGHLDRLGDPEPGPVRHGPHAARVHPAPAAQGDPGGARRVRRVGRRGQRAARAARRDQPARGRAQAGRPRARAPGEPAARGRRARRHPHVPGVDRLAAVGHVHRPTTSTCRTPAPCSTRTTTASSRSRTASSSSSPCGASWAGGIRVPRHDPLLRRPARRRQDVAGQVDRPRARARVRAHQRRRRARRGRDPRPPPHVHRRDARHDHPRAARRGLQQPAVHDRRDRQDGLGLPRRSGERDARGARPRAEPELPRPLPRPAVRPLQVDVHHDGEHARHRARARCATAWR